MALIESLNAAPAVIIGYSAGATIALKLAIKRPELVASLIFLEPVFNIKRCMTADFFTYLTIAKLLRRLRDDRHGAKHWRRYVSSYSTGGGSAFENKISSERREKLLANAGGIFADFASSAAEVDEHRFSEITVPVTIVEMTLSLRPQVVRRILDAT